MSAASNEIAFGKLGSKIKLLLFKTAHAHTFQVIVFPEVMAQIGCVCGKVIYKNDST